MVRHMKILLFIFCVVLLSSYSYSEEISSGQIVKTNGIVYEINPKSLQKFLFEETYTPFSGTVLYFHENGQLQGRENYQDGVQDGLGEEFFENGQLRVRENYKEDKLDGRVEWFYENGQIDLIGNWRDGKEEGLFEWFWDDGKLRYKGNYKDGKRDELWEGFYKNGQLEYRKNYKDGKLDGLWERFRDNGQLEFRRVLEIPSSGVDKKMGTKVITIRNNSVTVE